MQRINVICFAWNLNTNWPDHRLQRSEKETRRFKHESFSIIRYVVCYCDLCNLLSDKIFQLTPKSTVSSYFFPHKPELNSFLTSEKNKLCLFLWGLSNLLKKKMKLTTIFLLTASIICSSWAYPGEFAHSNVFGYSVIGMEWKITGADENK